MYNSFHTLNSQCGTMTNPIHEPKSNINDRINTLFQKYKNTKIQKYKNTKIQKYKNTKIQKTKIHVCAHVCTCTYMKVHKNTKIQKYRKSMNPPLSPI